MSLFLTKKIKCNEPVNTANRTDPNLFFLFPTNSNNVKKMRKSLKVGKASGADNISAEMLKELTKILSEPIN